MREEVNLIDLSSESWKSHYLSIEERDFVLPDTRGKKCRMYYVCKLMKASQNHTPCFTACVSEPNHGTSNLLRHLRNKHSINESEKTKFVGYLGYAIYFYDIKKLSNWYFFTRLFLSIHLRILWPNKSF